MAMIFIFAGDHLYLVGDISSAGAHSHLGLGCQTVVENKPTHGLFSGVAWPY